MITTPTCGGSGCGVALLRPQPARLNPARSIEAVRERMKNTRLWNFKCGIRGAAGARNSYAHAGLNTTCEVDLWVPKLCQSLSLPPTRRVHKSLKMVNRLWVDGIRV